MPKPRLSRRHFLQSVTACAATGAILPAWGKLAPDTVTARLEFGNESDGARVPPDFVGLSYEVMQLEDPDFFSPRNVGLVKRFREMSAHGVLRLGGNTSEFSWWKERATDVAPQRARAVANDGEPDPNTMYAVTPKAIRELAGFLRATGWTCIYGLNLGYGTPELATQEAVYVRKALGSSLQYFQIGNEVDLFWRHLRDKATWGPEAYLTDWLKIARAVQKAIPDASFGMPDVASDVNWLPRIAALWQKVEHKPRVTRLSHHYYFGGPPANPEVNLQRLLQTDPKVMEYAQLALPAAREMHAKLRMTEGNTCYQGGKPGVSDVAGSALWSAGYALRLAQLGYCGVNLHGGSGRAVAVSVGGVLRGEKLMKDPQAPHAKPFYTPIANEGTMPGAGIDGKLNGSYILQPVGEGLRFANYFAGVRMLPVILRSRDAKTADVFAGRAEDQSTVVAVINKSADKAIELTQPGIKLCARLTAACLDSGHVRFEEFTKAPESDSLTIAPCSAVILRMKAS